MNITTQVIFGYNVILDQLQAQELSKSIYTLVYVGESTSSPFSYIFGVELLKKKGLGGLGNIDLTQIDFAQDESGIQEELNKVNIRVDDRAKLLVCNT